MLVCEAWKHLRNVVAPGLESIQEEDKYHVKSHEEIVSDTKEYTTATALTQNLFLLWGCRPSEGILSDQMTIRGIPWSILKHKLLDQSFDAQAFGESLTEREGDLLKKLVKAQERQGDMNQLQSVSIVT